MQLTSKNGNVRKTVPIYDIVYYNIVTGSRNKEKHVDLMCCWVLRTHAGVCVFVRARVHNELCKIRWPWRRLNNLASSSRACMVRTPGSWQKTVRQNKKERKKNEIKTHRTKSDLGWARAAPKSRGLWKIIHDRLTVNQIIIW